MRSCIMIMVFSWFFNKVFEIVRTIVLEDLKTKYAVSKDKLFINR